MSNKQKLIRRPVECGACGKTFNAKKDHGKWQKFCNRTCFRSQQHHPIMKECAHCSTKFKAHWQSDKKKYQIYCSKLCYTETQKNKAPVNCDCCGVQFLRHPSKLKENNYNFCSVACRKKIFVGKDAPTYKGGSYVAGVGVKFVLLGHPITGAKMCYKGEHRLIAEKILGRKLKHRSEPILHLNRNKLDNRPENLYVCRNNAHMGKILQGGEAFPQRSNLT